MSELLLMDTALKALDKALEKIPEPHNDPRNPAFEPEWKECLNCGAETQGILCKECDDDAKLENAISRAEEADCYRFGL